jgi:hypothetical protein
MISIHGKGREAKEHESLLHISMADAAGLPQNETGLYKLARSV